MAYYDTTWYCNAGDQSTTGYYAVPLRPQNAAVVAGQLCRQFTAPAVGNERVFICYIAGTTANTTDASWSTGRGGGTTDGTAGWIECTGQAAMNGDLTNTLSWSQMKAAGGSPSLGQVIKRNNSASYQICTVGGPVGASEPAFSDTAGVTITDSTAHWTSLGPVTNFTGGQAPHARLGNAGATTWFAPNNTIYVGNNHAESQGSAISVLPSGSGAATIGKILCHNHSGNYPPASGDLTTGATVSTAGAFGITLGFTTPTYIYGISFRAGVGASAANAGILIASASATNPYVFFDNCDFELASTGTPCVIEPGTTSGNYYTIFNNTTIKFANAGHSILPTNSVFIWQNTGSVLVTGSSIPTNLFDLTNTNVGVVSITLEALDLSQLTGNLFLYPTSKCAGSALIKDCKLNASMLVGTPGTTGLIIQLVRSSN